jgi:hypothetical protein
MRTGLALVGVVTGALLLAGCPKQESDDPLTLAEAKEAVEESTLSDQAFSVVNGTVEISTNFTIGQAVEAAAEELRAFIVSQLPCAEITLAKATLSVEYGANPGNCTYHGHTYSGVHTVTVSRADGDVSVRHTWSDLSNGVVSVSGSADVTWSLQDESRHVKHELTWTRLSDGRQGVGSGDRTQTALAGGIAEGIRVDGARTWQGKSGRWDTSINDVEMRWVDPVPQSGSYVLATPFDKSLSMGFERVDEDTIKVTLASGGKSFSFNVNKAGVASGG